MNLNFQKALVTGGAGFIGSHLTETLVNMGCKVSVIDDLSSGRLSNLEHIRDQISFHKGKISDPEIMANACQGCEVIFHEAALVSVPKSVEMPIESAMINDIGTLTVLETARKCGVKRVVLASSSAVYGDNPESPKRENMAPEPLTPYAVQKLTGELNARVYHLMFGLETVCLRYFNVFGPRQDPSSPYSGVISIFLTKAASRQAPTIYGNGSQTRDFVFVKDVVKANLLAAISEKAAGKVFNVGTGSSVTIKHLWEMICRMSDLDITPNYAPFRSGDILESLANIDRAKAELGFKPEYSFEQGLKITSEWYEKSAKCKVQSAK